MPATPTAYRSRARWYSPHSIWKSLVIRRRVVACVAVGAAVYALAANTHHEALRAAAAWCSGGLVYLALSFRLMASFDGDNVRARAAKQDDSAVVILALILLAIFSSLAAIIGLTTDAKAAFGAGKLLYVGLTLSTIVISWSVMQVAFTFHYAHLYYAPENTRELAQGLEFVKTDEPDYWDFFYFATSIGAASQTSDTGISSREIRRLATLHAIVAFFFNTMVLALTINLAASLA